MIEDRFTLRVVTFLMLLAWMSEILLEIIVLILIFDVPNFLPTMLLTLIFSRSH